MRSASSTWSCWATSSCTFETPSLPWSGRLGYPRMCARSLGGRPGAGDYSGPVARIPRRPRPLLGLVELQRPGAVHDDGRRGLRTGRANLVHHGRESRRPVREGHASGRCGRVTLVREKRLNLGHLQVAVGIDADGVEQIRRSLPYRGALRPALRYLRRLTAQANGHHTSGSLAPVRPDSAEAAAIRRQVEQLDWYHTLDLPHGVSTPGCVDHRSQVPFYGFPDSMHGLRAL